MRAAAGAGWVALAGAAACGLAGCDDGSAKRMWNRIEADNARANPPQLWSAQALPERADAPPVTVCTDAALRDGFRSMTPQVGGQACARSGEGTKTATGSFYRCSTGAAEYAVSIGVTGAPQSDFTATTAMHALKGGSDFTQSVRYRKVGACPTGWIVGDATDRTGKKVSALSR